MLRIHAVSCLSLIHTSNVVNMFKRLKRTVFTLLHTVLGIKMTSSLEPAVLPLASEPIVPYCQRLAAMKKGAGITELKKWRVIVARAYKSKSTSRHEYVSVDVVGPQDKIYYVAIERQRGDPDPDQPQPLGTFSSSNLSLSSISLSSNSISPNRPVDDKISLLASPTWRKSDELVGELHFKEKLVYLYEIAILAFIVHGVNTSYLLMTNNCYHYAGTIMKVLEKEYEIADTAGGANAGKWCGVAIFSSSEGNFSPLLVKFKECIKEFVSLRFLY